MDFKPFEGKSDAGAVLVVMHPGTGMPTDAEITLAGIDSKAWRHASREINRQSLGAAGTLEQKVVHGLDRIERNKADLLASTTLSWENVELDGKALKCTHANAKKLYASYPWLIEQVNAFVVDRTNFFRSVGATAPEGDKDESASAPPAEGE